VKVRLAIAADIPAMLELERRCETAAHWTEGQYRSALPACGAGLTARLMLAVDEHHQRVQEGEESEPSLGGFLVARHLGPEWELENIVVSPASRRKGLGTRLMEEFFNRVQAAGSERVLLEVRESNQAARTFYEGFGLEETGRRKGYYADPVEDAILYRRKFPIRNR
jgi:[ribosomal protein S18]-alanine N-acetyltransferase